MEVVGSVKLFSASPANSVSGLSYSPSSYSSTLFSPKKKKKKKKKLLVVSKSKKQPQISSSKFLISLLIVKHNVPPLLWIAIVGVRRSASSWFGSSENYVKSEAEFAVSEIVEGLLCGSAKIREFQKRKSGVPKPATSYRRKKVEKEDLPGDTELYRDPTLALYYTNQGIDNAVPVLLVDGYNVCGYWVKLKKHFMNGRLDVARQKLIDELITFSMLREVKVVVVFDAMLSGLPTHKENFAGIDVVYSGESCADTWIETEVVALKEDGCPKVWVVTSDVCQQHAAHGACLAGAINSWCLYLELQGISF
uniref:RNA-binding protein containing a PIN domain n=1 Tax=Cucumis melo TaxID=3656 RepID=A0A9I9DC22_CUCME